MLVGPDGIFLVPHIVPDQKLYFPLWRLFSSLPDSQPLVDPASREDFRVRTALVAAGITVEPLNPSQPLLSMRQRVLEACETGPNQQNGPLAIRADELPMLVDGLAELLKTESGRFHSSTEQAFAYLQSVAIERFTPVST